MNKYQEYWSSPCPDNYPDGYLDGGEQSLRFIEFIKNYVPKNHKILEIGCNVGRNLNYLSIFQFEKLAGIEINQKAVELGKQSYPHLKAVFMCGAVEDIIKQIPDNSFDTIFTMAVLEHIPTESEWIFTEMVRVTDKYIITLEDEVGDSPRHFPRDYNSVFSSLGMKQVKFEIIDCGNYTLNGRIFIK